MRYCGGCGDGSGVWGGGGETRDRGSRLESTRVK